MKSKIFSTLYITGMLIFMISKFVTAATQPAPVFDQLSTQFLQTNSTAVIPIGATGLMNDSRLNFTVVSNLPNATLNYTTNSTNPGQRASANLIWNNPIAGNYTYNITAGFSV